MAQQATLPAPVTGTPFSIIVPPRTLRAIHRLLTACGYGEQPLADSPTPQPRNNDLEHMKKPPRYTFGIMCPMVECHCVVTVTNLGISSSEPQIIPVTDYSKAQPIRYFNWSSPDQSYQLEHHSTRQAQQETMPWNLRSTVLCTAAIVQTEPTSVTKHCSALGGYRSSESGN
ncbi:hypothetical protein Micbo1qcDRAFT_174934 [Microdochium bolleyi]|uniref:Uncharacterized protein n=1 Tax=Microdochium bolleyi TaxID=196109 RepID=A0A136J3V8_9PEZI|nr:hypothetical protein Micbo1qcDRAFT_174934 [Microdochium bolleyi]